MHIIKFSNMHIAVLKHKIKTSNKDLKLICTFSNIGKHFFDKDSWMQKVNTEM